MTPVIVLHAAQADLRRAARFYEEETAGLGVDFITEVTVALNRLEANPEIGAPLRSGARRVLVRRFPFSIIYRLENENLLVLAVGHQRRHPDFWLRRT